eukprot:3664735-Prorocentrum_lima.AAC.1
MRAAARRSVLPRSSGGVPQASVPVDHRDERRRALGPRDLLDVLALGPPQLRATRSSRRHPEDFEEPVRRLGSGGV